MDYIKKYNPNNVNMNDLMIDYTFHCPICDEIIEEELEGLISCVNHDCLYILDKEGYCQSCSSKDNYIFCKLLAIITHSELYSEYLGLLTDLNSYVKEFKKLNCKSYKDIKYWYTILNEKYKIKEHSNTFRLYTGPFKPTKILDYRNIYIWYCSNCDKTFSTSYV